MRNNKNHFEQRYSRAPLPPFTTLSKSTNGWKHVRQKALAWGYAFVYDIRWAIYSSNAAPSLAVGIRRRRNREYWWKQNKTRSANTQHSGIFPNWYTTTRKPWLRAKISMSRPGCKARYNCLKIMNASGPGQSPGKGSGGGPPEVEAFLSQLMPKIQSPGIWQFSLNQVYCSSTVW